MIRKWLVTGATGFVGRAIIRQLADTSDNEIRYLKHRTELPRELGEGFNSIAEALQEWTPDVVLNLSGHPIAVRWSSSNRLKIESSRIRLTRNLVEALEERELSPHLISASAIGYYGTSDSTLFAVDSPAGNDYAASLCQQWEQAALAYQGPTTIIRLGIVFGPGGYLAQLAPPIKWCLGAHIGSGSPNVAWIDYRDLCANVLSIANSERTGTFTLVNGHRVNQRKISETIAQLLNRKIYLSIPAMAIKATLGQMATELLLNGQQFGSASIDNQRLLFEHTDVEQSIAHALTEMSLLTATS